MKAIITVVIFCVVLFMYLHIYYYIKNSNDLEVYTIETPSKDGLEEICNTRQPVAFQFNNENILQNCNIGNFESNYGPFDVKIRNIKNNDGETLAHVPLILNEAIKVFENDEDGVMITENNSDYLEETNAAKNFSYNDQFLRPPLVSNCIYDFYSGSIGSSTPLRYDLNFRNFYYVTSGNVSVKLICPKYTKYLYLEKDYEAFEFRSPFNVWDIQDKYKYDFAKVKVLDIELKKGDIIFIPSYWWYSIRFNKISSVCVFKYRTFMNNVAILPHLFTSFLQRQNTKHDIVKKFENTVVNSYDIINNRLSNAPEENKKEILFKDTRVEVEKPIIKQSLSSNDESIPDKQKGVGSTDLTKLDKIISNYKNTTKKVEKSDGEELKGKELSGTYY